MRRFFVDPQNFNDDTIDLTGDELHHLKNVTRLEEGEFVELLDGEGHLAKAQIKSIDKKRAVLEIKERKVMAKPPSPLIQVGLCVPRFQTMDLIIQKFAELNVYSLTPLVSDRSFVKSISKDLKGKFPRWEKISLEACKQSGRAWPMKLLEPQSLKEFISKSTGAPGLFLYEGETSTDIKKALASYKNPPESFNVFVGAEGGFSPDEVNVFSNCGFQPVTMGPLVLRVETACIAMASVIEYHFDLLR